ncbi:hypothetical protein [Streptomyces hokutonensis]|uniref:hypothetical protein n=1 Tax=Streptomyces hokutonensis TaxID=1306990 RepID=UPI0036B5A525
MSNNHDPGEDVRVILSETGEWIRNADTKTGLLATVLAVLLGVISQKAENKDIIPPFSDATDYVGFCFLVVTVGAIVVSYFFFYRVLSPRVAVPDADTRFAWPWIAHSSVATLVNLTPSAAREEGWTQAKALALITQEKFRYFKRGLVTSAISGVFFLVWLVIIST